MELRDITRIDELSDLVSALTFDEFYQKIVEENRKYEEEYYEAFKALRLSPLRGLKRIIFGNWAIFGKIMKLWHLQHNFIYPKEYYQKRPLLWIYDRCRYPIILDKTSDTRPLFDSAKDIYDNMEQYKAVYELFEDETSKNVLMGLLVAKLTGDCRHLTDLTSTNPQYFDGDIIKAYANEVMVDAGGYVGDTAEVLLGMAAAKGKIKKVYLYEPNEKNMERAKKNLSKSDVEIVFRRAGVSDRRSNVFITSRDSQSRITDHGQESNKVELVTLDENIKEKITFIKMDIEGGERAALRGCQRHIREDAPKLAICVYHKPGDVWWLPQYIKSLNPAYRFYLRHHDPLSMSETVMYCLPR